MTRELPPIARRNRREPAYRVPFIVERDDAPRYRLRNVSDEAVHWVVLRMIGPGLLSPLQPCRLTPGSELEFEVLGSTLARASSVQVSWFRPGGHQYLWPITF